MKKKIILAAALCAAAAAAALAVAPSSETAPPASPFSGITSAELGTAGLTFASAGSALPDQASDVAKANSAASAALGGASVRESHYLHCVDTDAVPQIDTDCVAVSLDPSVLGTAGLPPWLGGVQHPFKWAIVLIDPATGAVLGEKASTQ